MFWSYILVILFLGACICDSVKDTRPKFIIDNDAGGDDAMAIFLALLYERYFNGPELIALTTGNGNTREHKVCINNQRILQVAGRQDVPIYRGSTSSLVVTPEAFNYYGHDGLGDSGDVYTDLVPAKNKSAIDALVELSKVHEGHLTVITIGTLTNIALAIKYDPQFLSRLEHLYVGAGHIHSENNPQPEFNARTDVEAYKVVVENATPDKVTLVPYSQIREHCNFTREWRQNVLGAIDTKIIKNQNKFEAISISKNKRWQALDPAVIALYVNQGLVKEYKYAKNNIITCGEKRGMNTNEFVDKEKANVRLIYSVHADKYKQFLLDVFSSNLNKK